MDFNPEEAVLKGTALQAKVLSNNDDDDMVSYLVVTPLSLGVVRYLLTTRGSS